MICVLDTSAAFEIAFSRPNAQKYLQLISNADSVISSALYKAETTNVLWKYVKSNILSESDVKNLLHLMLQYVDTYVDCADNSDVALHEGVRLLHPTYDMFYFTLAQQYNATLLTEDKKLANVARDEGIAVA